MLVLVGFSSTFKYCNGLLDKLNWRKTDKCLSKIINRANLSGKYS